MLQLFKKNRPVTSILVVFLGLILWIPSFNKPGIIVFKESTGTPAILFSLLQNKINISPGFSAVLSLIIVLFVAYYIVRLNTRYLIFNTRTQLPALVFVALIGAFSFFHSILPVYFALFFYLIAIYKIFATYRIEKLSYTYFDVGIWLGLSTMFYFESIIFLLTFWIALVLLKPSYWREFVFPILGMIVSYLFLAVILYLARFSIIDYYARYISDLFIVNHVYSSFLSHDYYLLYALFATLILLGSIFMIQGFQSKKVHARRYFQFFLWIFLICILAFLTIPSVDIDMVAFISVPLAYLIANYFIYCKSSIWNEVLFDSFLVLVIVIRYLHVFAPNLLNGFIPF
jgi:hypothetical protein